MNTALHTTRNRLTVLLGTGALIAGGAAAALLTAGAASATSGTCGTTPGANCTISGTATFTGGSLSVAGPDAMAWGGPLTGSDQVMVQNPTTSYTVVDPTGTDAGWAVAASATTFTDGPKTLPTTLVFDASTSSTTDTTDVPDAVCTEGSTCVPANNTITYPAPITTNSNGTDLLTNVLNAEVNSGEGSMVIGANTPGAFWIHVPANAQAAAYTSTITLAISSGPTGTIGS